MSVAKEVGACASEKGKPFSLETSAFEMVQRKGEAFAVAFPRKELKLFQK
ncbi:MAG: hypothetical protein ACI3XR_01915 [Eubacteriales bacterium]